MVKKLKSLADFCLYDYDFEGETSSQKLGLKKFGPGKLWVEKVWAQIICFDFLAELDNLKIFFFLF